MVTRRSSIGWCITCGAVRLNSGNFLSGKHLWIEQPMLYGTAKVIVEHIAEGQPYSQVKKVYSVNIVYFDLGQPPARNLT